MEIDIRHRWSGEVQFTAEIECDENASTSIKLGLAVRWGESNGANLRSANLYGANMRSANLYGANLSGANLYGADLSGADLSGANLYGADLSGADLSGADLRSADLSGADLSGADLRSANLRSADLSGADLSGAKWRDGITISQCPIFIDGLQYRVIILDSHMQIGCEFHRLLEWDAFDDRRIAQMDGSTAARFWRDYKTALLTTARAAGRSFAPSGTNTAEQSAA